MIEKLDAEAEALRERLATEKRQAALLRELNGHADIGGGFACRGVGSEKPDHRGEGRGDRFRQEKLIESLKRKKTSVWKRLADVLVGVGVGEILK